MVILSWSTAGLSGVSGCNIRVYIHPHVYQHLTGRAHLHAEKEEQLIAKWMFFLGRRYQCYLVIATLVTSRLLRLAGLVWNPASTAYVSPGSSPHLSGSVGEWQPPCQRPLGDLLASHILRPHHRPPEPETLAQPSIFTSPPGDSWRTPASESHCSLSVPHSSAIKWDK